MNSDNKTYFDSFGPLYILKENKNFIGSKNMMTNYYRVQTYD